MTERPITIEVNPVQGRFWNRLRKGFATRAVGSGWGIADLLLYLPDLTVLLARLVRDDRVPMVSKAVALAGLAYVISPLDLVPALLFGPVGLVDDLIIVAVALSAILNHVHPDVVRSHWPGRGDVLEITQRVTHWVERELVGGVVGVLARFGRR